MESKHARQEEREREEQREDWMKQAGTLSWFYDCLVGSVTYRSCLMMMASRRSVRREILRQMYTKGEMLLGDALGRGAWIYVLLLLIP